MQGSILLGVLQELAYAFVCQLFIPANHVKATRAKQKLKNWMIAHGISLDADDTGTNIVRKIRNAMTKAAVDDERSFNVSD